MSLIGKRTIPVPAGVEISIDGQRNVTVVNRLFTSELFSSPDGEWRIIYLKLVLHAAVPVICGCCAYAGWYVVLKW